MDLVKWWLGLTFINTPLVAEQTLDWWGVGTSGNKCVARQAKWRVESGSSSLRATGVAPGEERTGPLLVSSVNWWLVAHTCSEKQRGDPPVDR